MPPGYPETPVDGNEGSLHLPTSQGPPILGRPMIESSQLEHMAYQTYISSTPPSGTILGPAIPLLAVSASNNVPPLSDVAAYLADHVIPPFRSVAEALNSDIGNLHNIGGFLG